MRRFGPIEKLFILLSVTTFFGLATVRAESHKQRAEASNQMQASATPSDFVGSGACVTCHKQVAGKYSSNPHFGHEQNGKSIACESCHGPGKQHVESGGDGAKIFAFTDAGSKKEDDICLSCHSTSVHAIKDDTHAQAGIGCVGCHSVHTFKSEKAMLKLPETKLCESCHEDVTPTFELSSHHKVNEGVLACNDCHNPHAMVDTQSPVGVADQNQVCMNCHTDAAGPFIHEHPPVRTEGCISCHAPHGSKNPILLAKSNVNELCTQCHTATPNYSEPGTKPFHDEKTKSQPCTACHSHVHGSNESSFFFK